MNLTGMDDEQLAIAEKVGIAAIKYGLNPDFVLPMVQAESGFRHIKNPNSNAFGVMQLMPGTAKGLKVNPNDVDQNIEGGMRLLKELAANKNIGNDPYKILAGYTAGPATKFLTSGDMADLPSETLAHMHKVSQFHGKDLPPVLSGASEETAPTPVATPVIPVVAQSDKVKDIPKGEVGPTGAISSQKSPKELALLGGAIGAGTGAGLTGAYATYKGAQGVRNFAANLANVPRALQEAAETAGAASPSQTAPAGATSGEKWAVKTGYGKGAGTVQDVSSRFQRSIGQGKVSGGVDKLWGPALTGEDPQLAQRLIDRARAAEAARVAAAAQVAEEVAAATQARSLPSRVAAGLSQALPYAGTAAKIAGSTLGGIGAATQLYDAQRDYAKEGPSLRNAAKWLAGAGSTAAMIPSGYTQIAGGLAQIPNAAYALKDYVAERQLTDPVTNYETVPTMRPRQRATRAGFPGVYSGVQ
jgi:hypothetical protein